jgi:hypothetical protein
MRDFVAEDCRQSLSAIRKDLGVPLSTRNRDICHAGIEQVSRGHFCVYVNQDAVSRLALARMAGDGIAMIEMWMQARIERDLAATLFGVLSRRRFKPRIACLHQVLWESLEEVSQRPN